MDKDVFKTDIRPISNVLETCGKEDRPTDRAPFSYRITGKDKQIGRITLGPGNMKLCSLGVRRQEEQSNVSCLAMGPAGDVRSACHRSDIYAPPKKSSK